MSSPDAPIESFRRPRRGRRWLGLAGVVSLCLFLAADAWLYQRRKAVQARLDVYRLGGQVEARAAGSGFVGRILDARYAEEVVMVRLYNADITDDDLARLAVFDELEQLILSGTSVSNAGMLHVAKLPNLRRLALYWTNVTAAGLAELADLSHLEEVWIGPDMTDAEMKVLSQIRSLRAVNLILSGEVSDGGLVYLQKLPRLKYVRLRNTGVTQVAAERFRRARPDVTIISVNLR